MWKCQNCGRENKDEYGFDQCIQCGAKKNDDPLSKPEDTLKNQNISTLTIKPIYNTLLFYGKLISAVGWFILVVGIIVIIGVLIDYIEFLGALGGLLLIGIGLGMVVSGQVVTCFVAIEKNTRATYEALKQEK
jgi:hypothetical protein